LPYGGAKGGVALDPAQFSQQELEKISRAFVREIFSDLGPHQDVPAPDVGTDNLIMDYMQDEYSKLNKKPTLASFTGKSIGKGGSAGRLQATALGGFYVLEAYLKQKNTDLKGLKVAIQGFGNVGSHLAIILFKQGAQIIALSDVEKGIFKKDGLNIEKALLSQKEKGKVPEATLLSAEEISNQELLELSCDVLAPCAISHQITLNNAKNIKAKIILEMANAPIAPSADEVLNKKGLLVLPDILVNSGGVIVSYFEWLQNLKNEVWPEEKVFQQLKIKITSSFREVLQVVNKRGYDFRTAANLVAITRILEAEKERGAYLG